MRSPFSFFLLSVFGILCANPQNGSIEMGTAAMTERDALLEVQVSDRAVLNWDSFSIQAHETTRFLQSSADAAVLNRVMGEEISELMGKLQADGRVYLVNPNGVIVGPDAIINTAGFLATTLQISTEEFVEGKDLHFLGEGEGKIENLGTIHSRGPVILLSHRIENRGTIEASSVSVGAGREFLVKPDGEVDLFIRAGSKGLIENEGTIQGLVVELQSDGAQSLAINHKGVIQADRVEEKDGRIFLRASEGGIQLERGSQLIAQEGEIDLEAKDLYHMGMIEGTTSIKGSSLYDDGAIQGKAISIDVEKGCMATKSALLSAESLRVFGGSHILSSADCKAGLADFSADRISFCNAQVQAKEILVRGGSVWVNATSHLVADEGKVIVFAKERVEQQGQVNGDFVELSGEEVRCCPQQIRAKHFLLDPTNITFNDSTGGYPQYQLVDPDTPVAGFGTYILTLSTGNIAVANPTGGTSNQGAVYLFDGFSGAFLNSVSGTNSGDFVGQGGLTSLGNGNYVISSYSWNSSTGAATFVNGTSGLSGTVSSGNSLIGASTGDEVSSEGIVALEDGNYAVASPIWNSSTGAATWGDGSTGTTGVVSASNSLIGASAGDEVSSAGITALVQSSGHYVVSSPSWNSNTGAATWVSGGGAVSDVVDSSNSLTGMAGGDQVASGGVTALTNGNYVVASPGFDTDTGAATWGDGSSGTTGIVSGPSGGNSLVGANLSDQVSSGGITALTNGNYVIASPSWNGGIGAATWATGTAATDDTVTGSNSLVGSTAGDTVSSGGITALTNGNYVVASPAWSSNRGAATWEDGSSSTSSIVDILNSLSGNNVNDEVSSGGIVALTNGNYVVVTPAWTGDAGADTDRGAVTWEDGTMEVASVFVDSSNSLIGAVSSDAVGSGGVTALTNGNYVVCSPDFDGGKGAATWADGSMATADTVAAGNSILGSSSSDNVGFGSSLALTNGDYVVMSPGWGSNKGAATYADGTMATSDTVSTDNSVVGSSGTSGMGTVVEDSVNSTFVVPFASEGAVRIGLDSLNQLTALRAAGQTVTLSAAVVESLINAGTSVTLAASNNIVMQSSFSLSGSSGTSFNLTAGGDITISEAISSGDTSLSFTAGGNLTIDNSVTVGTSGSGNILLIAGVDLVGSGAITVQTTGTGSLTLVADNEYPSSPNVGSGIINFSSDATLSTGGGDLRIYTSGPTGNSYPTTINGATPPGTPVFGVYYPDGTGGVPFQIFYKGSVFTLYAQTLQSFLASVAQTFPTDGMLSQMEGDESGSVNSVDGLSTSNLSPCQGG